MKEHIIRISADDDYCKHVEVRYNGRRIDGITGIDLRLRTDIFLDGIVGDPC